MGQLLGRLRNSHSTNDDQYSGEADSSIDTLTTDELKSITAAANLFWKSITSESEYREMIPGLIDDMALCCLLRCSADSRSSCSKVSKSWNRVFKTRRDFFSLRKQLSIIDSYLSMFSYDVRGMRTQLKVINMTDRSCQSITVPDDIVRGRPKYLASVCIPHEGALFYIVSDWGGRFSGGFTNRFVKYDLRTNTWTWIAEIDSLKPIHPLEYVDGKIYATYGIQEMQDENEHYVVQVFDPEALLWDHVITPSRHRGQHVATVFDKQLLFSYVASHDRGRAYHLRSQTWREIGQELSGGLRADACFEMMGCLFVLEDWGTIRVYNERSKAWDLVEGDPMPAGDYICTRYVTAYDNKVLVVNIRFNIALGMVSRITEDNDESSSRFRVDCWTVVEVPENFRDFKPYDAKLLFA